MKKLLGTLGMLLDFCFSEEYRGLLSYTALEAMKPLMEEHKKIRARRDLAEFKIDEAWYTLSNDWDTFWQDWAKVTERYAESTVINKASIHQSYLTAKAAYKAMLEKYREIQGGTKLGSEEYWKWVVGIHKASQRNSS